MSILVIGVILIVLLVGITVLQALLRRRALRRERRLPFVAELEAVALPRGEAPAGFHRQYDGPVTSERLAFDSDTPEAALDALDDAGRLIGYRQLFRDPRSIGEITDVLLNWTVRRNRRQRQVRLDLTLYEDEDDATTAVGATPGAAPVDDDGMAVRIDEIALPELPFAGVRQWQRLNTEGSAVQRMLEVRWAQGRVACAVSGDSEPPGGVDDAEVVRIARATQERLAASPLGRAATPAS